MDISEELDTLCDLHNDWHGELVNEGRNASTTRRAKADWEKQQLKLINSFEALEERIAELEDALEKCKRGDE